MPSNPFESRKCQEMSPTIAKLPRNFAKNRESSKIVHRKVRGTIVPRKRSGSNFGMLALARSRRRSRRPSRQARGSASPPMTACTRSAASVGCRLRRRRTTRGSRRGGPWPRSSACWQAPTFRSLTLTFCEGQIFRASCGGQSAKTYVFYIKRNF